jgi:hypothetical protein
MIAFERAASPGDAAASPGSLQCRTPRDNAAVISGTLGNRFNSGGTTSRPPDRGDTTGTTGDNATTHRRSPIGSTRGTVA